MSRLTRPKTQEKRKWGRIVLAGLVVVGTVFGLRHIIRNQKVYT